jgi:hypothetical protein
MSSSYKGKLQFLSLIATGLFALPAAANQMWDNSLSILRQGKFLLQAGEFESHQGREQFIGIQTLIGDRFTVTKHNDYNFLVGLGYFLPAMQTNNIDVTYGLNVFYLAQTEVKGKVIQEDMFENLSYQYQVSNLPIYLAVKTLINTYANWPKVSLDLGIGPNVIFSHSFQEASLDGITLPDHAFNSNTTADFSATLGAGLVFEHAWCSIPVEIDYRFFYLGEGNFHKASSQLSNNLRTGHSYANALILSVSI